MGRVSSTDWASSSNYGHSQHLNRHMLIVRVMGHPSTLPTRHEEEAAFHHVDQGKAKAKVVIYQPVVT